MNYSSSNIRLWSRLGQRGVFGVALAEIAKQDEKLLVVNADLMSNTGLEKFEREFPDRIFNVGIAEENLIGVSSGLAREGFTTFCFSFAAFATARCLDFIRINMGYNETPVKLFGFGYGLGFGAYGYTHAGTEDIAAIRAVPNITIISPADCTEEVKTIEAVAKYGKPVYVRLGGGANMPIVYKEDYDFQIGKAITVREGSDIAIIACGTMVAHSLKAAETLSEAGISCKVVDMHTVKPLDKAAIDDCLAAKLIVTAEEHSVIGGLGAAVAEYMAGKASKPPQMILGIPEGYFHAGEYEWCMEQAGLTAPQVAERVMNKWKGL